MLSVAITGGIGAGKSTVTEALDALGAYIIDADVIAREVVEPGTAGLTALISEFGTDILNSSGNLDRQALAARAFADDAARARLNAIVHPLIGERTAELFARAPKNSVVIHDIPLLVEAGIAPGYHLVILVDTPADVRRERLMRSRGMSLAEVNARMKAQSSDKERRAIADVVVDNAKPETETIGDVGSLWVSRLVPFEHNVRTATPVMGSTKVVPANPDWANQAQRLIARITHVAGPSAQGVRHIGPTAVPGLNAPDILDFEVTVSGVVGEEIVARGLTEGGFVRDRTAQCTRFRGADPLRPVTIEVRDVDGEETLFAAMLHELLTTDDTAREEYGELLKSARGEDRQKWERERKLVRY